jgi:hypothetical protein
VTQPDGLRLVVFDRTCRGRVLPGLGAIWRGGGGLYRALGRVDEAAGAASWAEALSWLANVGAPAPIVEVQVWSHGHPGAALLGHDALDARALSPAHPLHEALAAVRARFPQDGSGLWWFRTCESFAGDAGRSFARAWTRFFPCHAAGHTRRIGAIQGGLQVLAPPGPADPGHAAAFTAWPDPPRTVTCLHGRPARARGPGHQ